MYLRSIVGVVALVVLCIPTTVAQAQELEPKQCLSMAEMNTALKAQGQRTLVIGNREALNNDATRSSGVTVTRYANAVTSNADGSVGYQLEGDLPRAQSSTRMCVVARLTNIRLIDARLPVAKPLSLFGPSFDAEMRQKEKIGTRPMVIADTVHRNADGSTRSGLPMIIFWNGGQRSASIYALRGENKPVMLVLMGDTDYTPYALQILDARRPSS